MWGPSGSNSPGYSSGDRGYKIVIVCTHSLPQNSEAKCYQPTKKWLGTYPQAQPILPPLLKIKMLKKERFEISE